MLNIALTFATQLLGQLRLYCRRCGQKLKQSTDNRLDAFCCKRCFDSYYRSRCLVCEQSFRRKTERGQVCNRSKCRHEFQRHRERFHPTRYPASVLGHNGSRSAHFKGPKIDDKAGRPFRQITGSALSPTSLRLAALPLDPEFAARLDRALRPFVEARAKAKRAAVAAAVIRPRDWPIDMLGGYRLPVARRRINLSPIEAPE